MNDEWWHERSETAKQLWINFIPIEYGLWLLSFFQERDNLALPERLRRNYVDGIRANFNNGRFGLTVGLHNGLWTNENLNDSNIGIDIAAALMIVPGLEWQIGYAYESNDAWDKQIASYNTAASVHNSTAAAADMVKLAPGGDHISQFNTFLTYKTGGLTLGIEYDMWDIYAL